LDISASQSGVVMMQLALTASQDDGAVISEISFSAGGTGQDDADVSQVTLYLDSDNDGLLGACDSQIGSASFAADNGRAVFSSLAEVIPQGSAVNWLLVYDFAGSASAGGTFSVEIASNCDIVASGALSSQTVRVKGAPVRGCTKTIQGGSGTGADESLSVALLTPYGPQKDAVLVSYVLAHDQSLPADIAVRFSVDGGITWADATEGVGGDGTKNSASTPGGSPHVFSWDSAADVPGCDSDEVLISVTPTTSNGVGQPRSTGLFSVLNDGGVNHAPFASFTVDKCHGKPSLSVNFDASASYDPDGDSLTFDWHFGTKYGYSGSGVAPDRTYSSVGFYLVTLTATDSRGLSSTVTHPIFVREQTICPSGWLNYTLNTGRAIELEYENPEIARVSPIGVTWENRVICCIEVSDCVWAEEPEPVGLLQGLIHGNEYMAGEVPIEAAAELVNSYGTSIRHTQWVNSNRIAIIPCVNPDGNLGNQRKNMRDNGDGSWGIDLNRNFPFHWGGAGSSANTAAWNYRGPAAASEPETVAIMGLAARLCPAWDLSYHSSGNFVLVPYIASGCSDDDEALLMDVADEMASLMKKETDDPYDYAHNMGSVCSGTDVDWMHNSFGTAAYVVEIGSGNSSTFNQETRDTRLDGAAPSWRYMLDRTQVSGLSLRFTDSETGAPVQAGVSFSHLPGSDGEDWYASRGTGFLHKLLEPGSYIVTAGCYGYKTQSIPVAVGGGVERVDVQLVPKATGNHKPTAVASTDSVLVRAGSSIAFSSEGSGDPDAGDSLSFTWDFGDGAPVSHQADPFHTFSSHGTYLVTLTVSDGKGGIDVDSFTLCVVDD
jgi:PKD repeat protein